MAYRIFSIVILFIIQTGCKLHCTPISNSRTKSDCYRNEMLVIVDDKDRSRDFSNLKIKTSVNYTLHDSIQYRAYIRNKKDQPINDAKILIKSIAGDSILTFSNSENQNGYYYFTIPQREFNIIVKHGSFEQIRKITEHNISNDKKILFFFGEKDDSLYFECSAISGCYLKPIKINTDKIGIILSKDGLEKIDSVKLFLKKNKLILDSNLTNNLSSNTQKYILVKSNELVLRNDHDTLVKKIRECKYFNSCGIVFNQFYIKNHLELDNTDLVLSDFSLVTEKFRVTIPSKYNNSQDWKGIFESNNLIIKSSVSQDGFTTFYLTSTDLGIFFNILNLQKLLINNFYSEYNLEIFQNH
jgi:hypothetical protein